MPTIAILDVDSTLVDTNFTSVEELRKSLRKTPLSA